MHTELTHITAQKLTIRFPDRGAMRRFTDLALRERAESPKRKELEADLLRNGQLTLDEIELLSATFHRAFVERIVTQREYELLLGWVKALVDRYTKPKVKMRSFNADFVRVQGKPLKC